MSHCSSTICCKGCPSCIELLLHFIKKNQLDIFVWACLWVLYSIPLIYTFIPLKYHTILIIVKVKMLVAQSCLSLCDPMNCSLSGSSVYAILQAKILEWIAIPFSRGSSLPKDQTLISCIADRFFTIWATREAPIGWNRCIFLQLISQVLSDRMTVTLATVPYFSFFLMQLLKKIKFN